MRRVVKFKELPLFCCYICFLNVQEVILILVLIEEFSVRVFFQK